MEVSWQSARKEDLFERIKWVVDKRQRGWTYREIAAQASVDNARSFYPHAADEEIARFARMRGVSISEANMSHYEKAWQDVASAAFDPDAETVWLSYQLAFRGPGSRDRRRALARESLQRGPVTGRSYFLTEGRRLLSDYPSS